MYIGYEERIDNYLKLYDSADLKLILNRFPNCDQLSCRYWQTNQKCNCVQIVVLQDKFPFMKPPF